MSDPATDVTLGVFGRAAAGPPDARERCTFCSKRRHQVAAMASAGDARICNDCLRLCVEIRYEDQRLKQGSPTPTIGRA